MTVRDSDNNHNSSSTLSSTAPRRLRSSSSSTNSSASLVGSKRSPSPIVAFTAAAHGNKGVKDITRKVIRRLEGMGHLDLEVVEVDDDKNIPLEEGEESEVEKELWQNLSRNIGNGNGHGNGRAVHLNGGNVATNGHTVVAASPATAAAVQKVDWEIPRKLLHASIGFVTVYGYITGSDKPRVMLVLWSALAIIVPADFLRFRFKGFARTYEKYLGSLMRESEKHSINGVVWYILGVNFVLKFYPTDVATVAILILSWADTAASTIGRLFGSRSPRLPARLPILRLPLAPRKSVAGFTAAAVTSALITAGFWGTRLAHMRVGGGGDQVTWSWGVGVGNGGWVGSWLGLTLISFLAGLLSAVAEALDLGALDDNLTLPIIAGGCILAVFRILAWFSS